MMSGTLSSSSSKIILHDFPPVNFCCGSEFSSSLPRRSFHLNFLRLVSVQPRILKPIPLPVRSSSIQVSQVNTEAEEIEALSLTKTVRARFQLQKECVFGDHFFIIGDDPVFGGLWDIDNALPLHWSDGHVWTVDLDLPVGRFLEFKFILKAKTGEILWQPGPNRAFETWPTNNTLRICEDWENADLQMVIEEDFETQCSVDSDMPLVAQNISSNNAQEEDELPGTVQQNSSQGYFSDVSEENSSSDIQNDKTMDSSIGTLTAGDANVTKEEGPVLVPGLVPLCDLTYVSMEVTNEGKAETFPEVHKKQETEGERKEAGKVKGVSLFEKSEEETEKAVEKEEVGTPQVVIENDMEWGRKTLYKLLSNFGLF